MDLCVIIRLFIGIYSYLTAMCSSFLCHTAHPAMYVYQMENPVVENGTSQIMVRSQNDEFEIVKINLK